MPVEIVLRMSAVLKATGLCRAQIYNLMRVGKFPKSIKITERSRGWLASEVAEWQQSRIAERDGADA